MNYYIPNEWIAPIVLLVVWELTWKVVALIKAAKAKDWFWFWVIAVISCVGILPILYVFRGDKFVRPKP